MEQKSNVSKSGTELSPVKSETIVKQKDENK